MQALPKQPARVTVIDMQPITPAIGGGRQRLLGLYHALGSEIECTYVGAYDWPGEPYRDQQTTPGLREIVVPLSPEHHAAAAALSQRLGGCTAIDIAFPDQVALSPDFLRAAREHIADADVVIFSHPWCFLPLADVLRADQLIVYDSHNVEALLRTELLGVMDSSKQVVAESIVRTEQTLIARAHLVLACSEEDVDLYLKLFDADPIKFRIVPNGTFVERFPEPTEPRRLASRKELGLPPNPLIAIFLGSQYGPNVDAARFIAKQLAPTNPAVLFVVAGGVGAALADLPAQKNLMTTGGIDDATRDAFLLAADLALNPMNAGSGTNIKMLDYMAAGLPVLTTAIGARGIRAPHSAPTGMFVESLADFPARCTYFGTSALADPTLGRAMRATVRRQFSWERISKELGRLLISRLAWQRNHKGHRPRAALMATWNIACGISEHSHCLAEAIEASGAELIVLGNDLKNHDALGFERDLHTAVSRAWYWDNLTWQSHIDRMRVDSVLRRARPDLLLIQHHTGYAPFLHVEAMVQVARAMGISVVIELHDARNMSAEHKDRLCAAGGTLVVHHADGLAGISPAHIGNTCVLSLPVRRYGGHRDSDNSPHDRPITIGGFGFLRPYKGLPVLIQALAMLRPKYPEIRYRGLHAIYPGDISENHLQECLQLSKELGIADAIEIETDFLPIEEIGQRLSATDIVVLPYAPSGEGASSAVNQALAAGRPVVVSPSTIFKPVADMAFVVPEHTPDAYASALDRILSDPALSADLKKRASAWMELHSYARAVDAFLKFRDGHKLIVSSREYG
ncbi:MAG: glycosyltransferase [Pseudomonadota bacterium]|nr:glycosyltransferase [Pseudomonadota bacterium]